MSALGDILPQSVQCQSHLTHF